MAKNAEDFDTPNNKKAALKFISDRLRILFLSYRQINQNDVACTEFQINVSRLKKGEAVILEIWSRRIGKLLIDLDNA